MKSRTHMMTRVAAALIAPVLLVGCASHDRQNVRLLGAAMDHNTAVQSVRDVDEPNARPVEGHPK